MLSTKLEVLVDLGDTPDQNVLDKTLNELKSRDGIKEAVFKNGAFVVETSLPSAAVVDLVAKASGRRTVLQGFGDTQAAVAAISSPDSRVVGVIRLVQQSDAVLADGALHGLAPGPHGLHVRSAGDVTQGCESLGPHYDPRGAPHGGPSGPPHLRHAGDFGNIHADEQGRASFRILAQDLTVSEIIGRSLGITQGADDLGLGDAPGSKVDGNSGPTIACGIIARSAGIFENPKRLCACDGVVVWDERDRPLAGKGRRVDSCCKKETEHTKPCCKV